MPTEVTAGDYVIIPNGAPHSLHCLEAARILIYRQAPSWLYSQSAEFTGKRQDGPILHLNEDEYLLINGKMMRIPSFIKRK